MNIVDYDNEIPFRLFREHCQQTSNGYIKNLSRLGRNLKDVIIIDNSPFSFCKQQTNALPILSWYDDQNDIELLNFLPILEFLNKHNDVRAIIPLLVCNDQVSYTHFNKLISEEKKPMQIKDILRNISPKSVQNKKIDFGDAQSINNPNEAKVDDQLKPKLEKRLSIPTSIQFKQLPKLFTKMSATAKYIAVTQEKLKMQIQPKLLNSESLFNISNKSSTKQLITSSEVPNACSIKETRHIISTPKESSLVGNPTIFKFTGLKLKHKDQSKSKYTNLIRLGINSKDEINEADDDQPIITPKKPLLINNLMKVIRSSSHLGNQTQKGEDDDMREELNINSPKHPNAPNASKNAIVKSISPEILKGKIERPVTSALRNPPAIIKVCHHEKRNSLGVASDLLKKQPYLLKVKK